MLIVDKFKKLWLYYILQTGLASVVIFVISVLFKENLVIIASIGATAFICFALPKVVSAKTSHVLGGYLVALICGEIFSLTALPDSVKLSLAIGLALFLMVTLDVEHPPAVGAALAFSFNGLTMEDAAAVMGSILIITQCRYLLRHVLKDLL